MLDKIAGTLSRVAPNIRVRPGIQFRLPDIRLKKRFKLKTADKFYYNKTYTRETTVYPRSLDPFDIVCKK